VLLFFLIKYHVLLFYFIKYHVLLFFLIKYHVLLFYFILGWNYKAVSKYFCEWIAANCQLSWTKIGKNARIWQQLDTTLPATSISISYWILWVPFSQQPPSPSHTEFFDCTTMSIRALLNTLLNCCDALIMGNWVIGQEYRYHLDHRHLGDGLKVPWSPVSWVSLSNTLHTLTCWMFTNDTHK